MSSFDPTKPVQTRDGREARIVSTDRVPPLGSALTVIALVSYKGQEIVRKFRADGRITSHSESKSDLVNVPQETVEYRGVGLGGPYGAPRFGVLEFRNIENARSFAKGWDGIAKITKIDGKLTGLEFIPA